MWAQLAGEFYKEIGCINMVIEFEAFLLCPIYNYSRLLIGVFSVGVVGHQKVKVNKNITSVACIFLKKLD